MDFTTVPRKYLPLSRYDPIERYTMDLGSSVPTGQCAEIGTVCVAQGATVSES